MLKKVNFVVTCDYAGSKNFFGDVYPENSFVSFAWSTSGCNNLLSVLDGIGGLKTVNICTSFKRAEEIANAWNETYKQNGTYFDRAQCASACKVTQA